MKNTTSELFPCPFCRSAYVSVVGAARRFLHYRCATCEEVWTAMRAAEPAQIRAPKVVSERLRAVSKVTCH